MLVAMPLLLVKVIEFLAVLAVRGVCIVVGADSFARIADLQMRHGSKKRVSTFDKGRDITGLC